MVQVSSRFLPLARAVIDAKEHWSDARARLQATAPGDPGRAQAEQDCGVARKSLQFHSFHFARRVNAASKPANAPDMTSLGHTNTLLASLAGTMKSIEALYRHSVSPHSPAWVASC